MNNKMSIIPGASITRLAKRNFLCFRLQYNGLFNVIECNYTQDAQVNVHQGFEGENMTVEICVKLADILGANNDNLQDGLYQLQARIEEFQEKLVDPGIVVRDENGIHLYGEAAELFLQRKKEAEISRRWKVAEKMFEVFRKEGRCNIHGNDLAGCLIKLIESNDIPYEIHPFPDYDKFVKK